MIRTKTSMNVGDNSGGVVAECIRVLGKSDLASVGSVIVVTVKRTKWKKKTKVKNHGVYYGLVIRSKNGIHRFNGVRLRFKENSIVLLDKKLNPLFNRIFGPVPYELRKTKFVKLLLMGSNVI